MILFNVFVRFNTADLDRIPCRFIKERWGQKANGQKPKAKSQKPNGQKNNLCMTPIHGETDILRRLRNVEARTQMANSQNTNGHETQSNGQRMQTTVLRSQWTRTWCQKVKQGFLSNGPEYFKKTSPWAWYPPWFAKFLIFIYFSFLFFYLFLIVFF